jgi:hypothetical protein
MAPDNSLVDAPGVLCLARPGEVYAVYLPKGGTTKIDLGSAAASYRVGWYNPCEGGGLLRGTVGAVTGPGQVSIGSPPRSPGEDWAVLLRGPPRDPRPEVLGPMSVTAYVGRPFSHWIAVDSDEAFTLELAGLPAGLAQGGGRISGVPRATGLHEVEVRAANRHGTVSRTLRIEVTEAPSRTRIVRPSQRAELVEGRTVVLEGRGGNLRWSYDANSDKKGRIEIGSGARVKFEVPRGVVGPRTLKLMLEGDGGAVSQEHRIVGP